MNKEEIVKRLQTEITQKGFTYKQERRSEFAAIYYQYDNENDNEFCGYEVIRIKVNPAGHRFGQFFEASESYPTERVWGVDGWTFCKDDFKSALAKFEKIKDGKKKEAKSGENSKSDN